MGQYDRNLIGSFEAFVEECITNAYDHTLSMVVSEDGKAQVQSFILTLCSDISIHSVFTTAGGSKMVDLVFEISQVRDFVFRLTSEFYTRFGSGDEGSLMKTLCNSLCVFSSAGKENTLIPDSIASRLPEWKDIAEILRENKWLVVLTLTHLYIQPYAKSGGARK